MEIEMNGDSEAGSKKRVQKPNSQAKSLKKTEFEFV